MNGVMHSYARIERGLIEEAKLLQRASDSDVNDYVVKLYGVSTGKVTQEWVNALGHFSQSVLLQVVKEKEKEKEEVDEDASASGGAVGDVNDYEMMHDDPLAVVVQMVDTNSYFHQNTNALLCVCCPWNS